jgi:hypothetical protein
MTMPSKDDFPQYVLNRELLALRAILHVTDRYWNSQSKISSASPQGLSIEPKPAVHHTCQSQVSESRNEERFRGQQRCIIFRSERHGVEPEWYMMQPL